MRLADRILNLIVLAFLVLGMLVVPGDRPAQAIGEVQEPVATGVDLASVPVPPSGLPERGFQLAQAGELTLSSFHYAWSGDDYDESEWVDFDADWERTYSQLLVLLTDRAEPTSDQLASIVTYVIGMTDERAAVDAVDHLFEVAGQTPSDEIAGALTLESRAGAVAALPAGNHVIWVQYTPEVEAGPGQNREDWNAGSLVEIALATAERLEAAQARFDAGKPALGVANALVLGPDALWTIPWPYFPITEHYRVLEGEVLPYGGELSADARGAVPDGVVDLYVSRQQLGDQNYDHLIDVTLARFESEADAAAFAEDPLSISFPPAFAFDARYSQPERDGDVVIERVAVNDQNLRASGWRAIRQEGDLVEVVQWLGGGNAMVSKEAFASFAAYQSACLDAMPEPCAPIDQEDLGVAVDEESAVSIPDQATPAATGDGTVVASPQFGWSVLLPDDGWTITDVQIIGTSEYYQLQSGRSLLTIETAVDQVGDPQQCVLDNMHLLQELEDRAVIELGSDDTDERAAGLEQGHGWAIYTVEPLQEERADQEYTIRIDCYTLVEGQASLVVTHTAPRDLWIEERDKGERFRDAIVLP